MRGSRSEVRVASPGSTHLSLSFILRKADAAPPPAQVPELPRRPTEVRRGWLGAGEFVGAEQWGRRVLPFTAWPGSSSPCMPTSSSMTWNDFLRWSWELSDL